MAEENERKSSGFLKKVQKRVAGYAGGVKESATAAWTEQKASIREAIEPEKHEPVKAPERPFGREEGGEDVKRVVWSGHAVETPGSQRYYGAVGLTESGYYRAAEVQQYGAQESWRWQEERHTVKEDAIQDAQRLSAERLSAHDRLMTRSAAHAARDVLHDASAGLQPGAYTVQEARDRAAHTPSVTNENEPRTSQEEWRLVREVSARPGAKEYMMERMTRSYQELQADASAAKTIEETKADMTPEQQANVNKMLAQTSISREQIGGASDPGQSVRPLETPKMPEPPQGSPQQGRSLPLEK